MGKCLKLVSGEGRMGKRAAKDIGWEHCSKVEGNPNRVSCNYCGHHMYGITRLKEHLAHFGTDVVHCQTCPAELKSQMGKLLLQRGIQLSEKRRKRGREDEDADLVEEEEKAALEKALQDSLETLEMEKKKSEEEDEELEAACRESARIYREQELGEGCSEALDDLDEEIDLNVGVSADSDMESNHH